MIYNKKYIISLVVAFLVGYGCAAYLLSHKHATPKGSVVKEYAFLGDEEDTIKGDEIDYSIYAEDVQLMGNPHNVISNDSLAVEMAKLVLFPIYGKNTIERERPYRVTLVNNEYWYITGSLPENALGGTFFISINKQDGKIISIGHEK